MAWVDIKTWTFTPQTDLTVHLQYDDTSKTVTSVNVRVILTFPSGWYANSYASDAYCLLWGEPSSNTVYNIKGPDTYWGSANPDVITVTKAYNSSVYTIPSFWVCVTGYQLPFYKSGMGNCLSYGGVTDTVYNWFKADGYRKGYKLAVGSQTLSSGPTAASGSAATGLSIVDKGNNTFTIKGKTAANGANNNLTSTDVWYTTDGSAPNLAESARTQISISSGSTPSKDFTTAAISIPSEDCNDDGVCHVRVGVFSYFTYGTENGPIPAYTEAYVKYHTKMGGTPSISIKDNGNNTFTISSAGCTSGLNNSVTNSVEWGYSASYGNSGNGIKELTIVNESNATRTVYAKITSTPSWAVGDTARTASTSAAIKQYIVPSAPGKPALSETSLKNGRLTLKKNWTFLWTPAQPTNNSSPVAGYRIRIYKNGVAQSNLAGNPIGEITKSSNVSNFVDLPLQEYSLNDIEYCLIKFNPVELDFKVGDTAYIGVIPYAKNGIGTQLFCPTEVYSDSITVENAGIVHVKVGNEWKEGQVWVRADGSWHEAETVNVKTASGWKESQ